MVVVVVLVCRMLWNMVVNVGMFGYRRLIVVLMLILWVVSVLVNRLIWFISCW